MRRQHGQIGAHRQLGQMIDPSTGIIADVQLGPEDTSSGIQTLDNPDILSTHGYSDYGASGTPTPAPSSPTSTGILATFGPYGTLDPTAAGTMAPTVGVPSPAPRVGTLPPCPAGYSQSPSALATCSYHPALSSLASGLANVPMVAWLGIGVVALLALSGGGGRRRR